LKTLLRRAPPAGGSAPERTAGSMIVLSKLKSREKFLVNHNQIQHIEFIPETKVVMMNRDYYLVEETGDEIIQKIADYTAKVMDIHRQVTLVDKR
jgi:flagellar protein FlbD